MWVLPRRQTYLKLAEGADLTIRSAGYLEVVAYGACQMGGCASLACSMTHIVVFLLAGWKIIKEGEDSDVTSSDEDW